MRIFQCHMGCSNHRSFDPCFLGMVRSQITKLIFNAITFVAIIRNSNFQIENVSSLLIFVFQDLSNGIKGPNSNNVIVYTFVPKIQDIYMSSISKVRIHLEVLGFNFLISRTFYGSVFQSQVNIPIHFPSRALTLIASSRLGSQQYSRFINVFIVLGHGNKVNTIMLLIKCL